MLKWFGVVLKEVTMIFVGYMIVEIQVTLSLTWNFARSGIELRYFLG